MLDTRGEDELLIVTDSGNNRIADLPYPRVVMDVLWHRAGGLIIEDSSNYIWLHKRGNTLRDPYKQGIVVGGGQKSDEPSSLECAIREAKEEIGLELNAQDLEWQFPIKIDSDTTRVHMDVYLLKDYDEKRHGPIVIDGKEIIFGRFMTHAQIRYAYAKGILTESSRKVWEKYSGVNLD